MASKRAISMRIKFSNKWRHSWVFIIVASIVECLISVTIKLRGPFVDLARSNRQSIAPQD